jgi:hypothetical protein
VRPAELESESDSESERPGETLSSAEPDKLNDSESEKGILSCGELERKK